MSVESESRPARLGLSELLKASLSTFLGTVQTRLEIVSTEIEEERERLEEEVMSLVRELAQHSEFVKVLGIYKAA